MGRVYGDDLLVLNYRTVTDLQPGQVSPGFCFEFVTLGLNLLGHVDGAMRTP